MSAIGSGARQEVERNISRLGTNMLTISTQPGGWKAETIPAAPESSRGAATRLAPSCPPMDPQIQAEVKRVASLDSLRSGGSDALAAALIGSEARKNAILLQAIRNYELCRVQMR